MLMLCLLLAFGNCMTVFAYNGDDYDTTGGDGSGEIIIDDTHKLPQKLHLYLLTENDMNYTTCWTYYAIYHFDDSLPTGQERLMIKIYCPDLNIIDTLDGCNIYEITVGIEPGTYGFSAGGGMNGEWTSSLTQGFKSPFADCGYYTGMDFLNNVFELTEIGDGDSVSVYGLYGSDKWRHDNGVVQSFASWARGFDEDLRKSNSSILPPATENTKVQTQENVYDVSKPEPKEEPKEEFVPSEGPTRVSTTTTTVVEPSPVVVEQPTSSPVGIVIGGIFFVVVVAYSIFRFVIVKIRNREDDEE